ncbi:MAG: cobaltochelatase subunit CobN [Cyanobacteria bacterium J06623_4]
MHRLAATPGGWDATSEGVIFIDQSPAPVVLLTAADTDISSLHQALQQMPEDFSDIRSVNLLHLQQQLTIDTYADTVLQHAKLIILRVLGGRAYWPYGLEVTKETVAESGAGLIVIPGDDRPDLDLMSHSTVPLAVVNRCWQYFTEGGVANLRHGLLYASDCVLSTKYDPPAPQTIPKVGIFPLPESTFQRLSFQPQSNRQPSKETEKSPIFFTRLELKLKRSFQSESKQVSTSNETTRQSNKNEGRINPITGQISSQKGNFGLSVREISPQVGILFYRAHYLSGNTAAIEALAIALYKRGLIPVPIYVSSLKDIDIQQRLIDLCLPEADDGLPIQLLINTTSFAITSLNHTQSRQPSAASPAGSDLWQRLDIPVLQAICSGSPVAHWKGHPQGLTPRDIAMNVALPEVDGRIITRAVSFKAAQPFSPPVDKTQPQETTQKALQKALQKTLQTDIVSYEPLADRIHFVCDLAVRWIHLRQTPVADRKVALILANYPNRDGRMANGVGLDTPASCLEILRSLQQAGYTVTDLPETSDQLMARLAAGITNDPEGHGLRPIHQSLSIESYRQFWETLSPTVQTGITQRWGSPEAEWQRFTAEHPPSESLATSLPISGIQFGNVFVGIQPSRGYDIDPSLNYHAPDLEPTHAYMGFYCWVRSHFQAQAIVHVGKHGNLEWLPGKGIALSKDCYPEAAFGPLPHFYPFIVNDPGEGAQAKRRAQAVILDHLTPPMTRADLYGPLQQLESLVDEYYEAQNLDPSRLRIISLKIVELLKKTELQQDLRLSIEQTSADLQTWLPKIDGYLCELKEAQIRDGLHIFGLPPQGEQTRDLIVAIARHPNAKHVGLSRAIAQAWDLDIDPLTADVLQPYDDNNLQDCRHVGDIIERIEDYAIQLIGALLGQQKWPSENYPNEAGADEIETVLGWVSAELVPALARTTEEIDNLLHGLSGGYVPSGPSGAPTRNRPEVLPTGRNFYSVDIRAIPTESAWDVGRRAAEILIENYTQEEGEYPCTLGLSMWGTSAMRTGGDDMAEALALLGVRPVWDGSSRRVVDFEILPVSSLGRPRVDVTLRISGFFRDAFPNLISLFDQAVTAVASLDEPAEQNPLAAQFQKDYAHWQSQGLDEKQSAERSRYRIFGSKPGAYGAGLQGLIEAQNWESDADLARAYINWSSYAYTGNADGHSAPESFAQRLETMQIVLQNQDNREHDLLDSDDYYQFQGGLTAAVKAKRGESPVTYFGDNSVAENPRVRSLQSEIARVYRSRVVNPKWVKGVMRHGYKGAFEMAATVDYLFAYDATTHCVADHMYTGVAEAYVFNEQVREFVEQSNPWALRDMAERLLEAQQRGLWSGASEKMVDGLRAIAHEAEGKIEAGLSNHQ